MKSLVSWRVSSSESSEDATELRLVAVQPVLCNLERLFAVPVYVRREPQLKRFQPSNFAETKQYNVRRENGLQKKDIH